jgi:hypothetical protein
MYQPVLPFRHKQKLLFCLRRSCVLQQKSSDECGHGYDAQRFLTGTWISDDVPLAVKWGYRILEILKCTNTQ